ncbi:MAG: hypothetical protein GXP10_10370, partial [Gammaproteobacteria bacterium]|nr:hypothetical protein [Gammaproteobacteria bacterium]
HFVMPLFAALVRADQLAQLTQRFSNQDWSDLAQAAVVALVGRSESLSDAARFISGDSDTLSQSSAVVGSNMLRVNQSLIARAVVKQDSSAQSRIHLSALAVLVAVEVSPELFLVASEHVQSRLHVYREALKLSLSSQPQTQNKRPSRKQRQSGKRQKQVTQDFEAPRIENNVGQQSNHC